jgi:hypothetical protein
VTLARYRLRPLPWGRLVLAALAVGALAHRLYQGMGDPLSAFLVLPVLACLWAAPAALLTAPETDPDADAQEAAPVGAWRLVSVRLAAWTCLGVALFGGLSLLLDGSWGWSRGELLLGALPVFWLVSAVNAAVAACSSTLAGAAGGLGAVVLLWQLPMQFPNFPVQLFVPPTDPAVAAGRWWAFAAGALLLALVVVERARRGLRGPLPRRGVRQPATRARTVAAPR